MSSDYRNNRTVIRSLLFVCLLYSGSSLEAQIEAPTPVPKQEAPSQLNDSSDDSELKLQNYQLKHANAADILKLWKQLHGIKNGASIDERTNSIVFFANDEGARELGESLALLDSETPSPIIPPTPVVQGSSPEVRVPNKFESPSAKLRFRKYAFKHAKVADVLNILREAAGGSDFDSDDMEGFVVDERTNSFIWKVDTVSLDFEEVCMKLDTESPASLGKLKESASPLRPADDNRSDGVSLSFQTLTISLEVDRSNTVESLKQRYNELEQKAHQLADKLKQSTSLSESDRIELQQTVRKSFEARQALQRAELADLAGRMKSMQQSIDMRDKLADKVIERRVEDLLNPNLKWDVNRTSTESTRAIAKEDLISPSKITSSQEMQAALQGTWTVRAFQANDQGDDRLSQVVIRGDLLLMHTIVNGKVIGVSPWKLVWPNAEMPYEIGAMWDPNTNTESEPFMPGRIAYDGKSFQLAFGENPISAICPGENVTYIDCVRDNIDDRAKATADTNGTADSSIPSSLTPIFNTPQILLGALEQYGKSGSYEDYVRLFNDDGVRDLAVFDWSDLLKLLPESGTVLVMFSHEPDKREQMLPIAEKVAEVAAVKLIHLPIDNWRSLFSQEATHFVLMKDRQLIGTKTGLVTEAKLKEFVAQAKDWLTPQSTGVSESSLVRVDCYISPGNDNIGSQHGPAIPITLAVVAIDGDEALLFGTEGIANYLEKGYACVAIVRDEEGNEKQVPLEVVLTGNVPLKKPDALNDDDALVITIPFFKYDKESIELQEAYDVGSAIYRIRDAHGLTTVKLAPFDTTPQKGERVLAGKFNSSRHHGPIHGFQSPFHWQTQQNQSESEWPIYGANLHGAKMFQVLCPTIPAPSTFLFNAHGRLIGTHGLGNLTEKDKTYTALMPYAIHSVLRAGLEAIDHAGLKAALKQTLQESISANQSAKTSATAEPKYSGHPISWWLDSYWDNATASSKTSENIAQEYVASEAIRKLREKPECKAAIEAALAKWFASVEHEVNEIQLTRAAKCIVTIAGPTHQETAVNLLFKIWKQMPLLTHEQLVEAADDASELNQLLSQLVLNDQLAVQFADRLTNGNSTDRSLVVYGLLSLMGRFGIETNKDLTELENWLRKHAQRLAPALEAASKDENEHIRFTALIQLATLIHVTKLDPESSRLPTILLTAASDASPGVRYLAIDLLTSDEFAPAIKSQNAQIASMLISAMESDSSINVRYSALNALMHMNVEAELVHKTLMEWAKSDEHEKVKYALDLTLRNHEAGDRTQSIDELIELLSDPEWGTKVEVNYNNWSTHHRWARQYAIAILGQYAAHAHRAIPTLEAELARNNKDTVSFATKALDSVRGYCPDLPIDKLQGEWEFVSMQKPEGSSSFFDCQTSSDQQPSTVITISGTQLKLGDRVLAELSHYRSGSRQGVALLLDPDGKKRHCHGGHNFKDVLSPEYKPNATPAPELLILEVSELLNNLDATQATKQIYEFRRVISEPKLEAPTQ